MPQFSRFWLSVVAITTLLIVLALLVLSSRLDLPDSQRIGEQIDALDGVAIYHNGVVNPVRERHLSADGYNLGLRYQCVEFVKRYYFEHFKHRMPNTYGHAKDYFISTLNDGALNPQRGLLQFSNGSLSAPQKGDLLVFSASWLNRFGHVAIVADKQSDHIQIAQQNAGPYTNSREEIALVEHNGLWFLDNSRVLGWLRMPPSTEPVAAR